MPGFGLPRIADESGPDDSVEDRAAEGGYGCFAGTTEENTIKRQPRQKATRWPPATKSSRCSEWHTFADDQRGVSAVEFAFVLPVLIILLTGIIQMGLTFFVQHNMVSVSQETARLVALDEMTEAQGESYANGKLISWGMTYDVDVQQVGDDIVVDISVPLSEVALIDYLGLFKTGDLSTQSSMRAL